MRFLLVVTSCLCLVSLAHAASIKNYQRIWAEGHQGQINARLIDGSRCDVLTPTHAVEVAFADEWQAVIGQSLNHAMQAGKHAGVVLIVQNDRDTQALTRLRTIILTFNLPIDVWVMGPAAPKGSGSSLTR